MPIRQSTMCLVYKKKIGEDRNSSYQNTCKAMQLEETTQWVRVNREQKASIYLWEGKEEAAKKTE